jgi:hypothetical protein
MRKAMKLQASDTAGAAVAREEEDEESDEVRPVPRELKAAPSRVVGRPRPVRTMHADISEEVAPLRPAVRKFVSGKASNAHMDADSDSEKVEGDETVVKTSSGKVFSAKGGDGATSSGRRFTLKRQSLGGSASGEDGRQAAGAASSKNITGLKITIRQVHLILSPPVSTSHPSPYQSPFRDTFAKSLRLAATPTQSPDEP